MKIKLSNLFTRMLFATSMITNITKHKRRRDRWKEEESEAGKRAAEIPELKALFWF